MDYKERYEHAIKRAEGFLSQEYRDVVEYIFPELTESEDEKIRKEIITLVKNTILDGTDQQKAYLAWLEKQGQKLDAWSEEDKNMFKWVIGYLENKMLNATISEERTACKNAIAWLLKKQGEQKPYGQREECKDCQMNYAGECKGSCVLKRSEQKPVEWSKEDEALLKGVITDIESEVLAHNCSRKIADIKITWLKSLRPQSHWKPSDEQMSVIEAVINNRLFQRRHLDSLYEQLKKLKG